ncbi:DEAD/DEAH box helicase [Caproiciproducens sp. MSJ-32]|uniref:DEAD/DEAH box helicase n=1 Tax=Caproiciproducens sp. MSJ-32 TaxID=2841527 RepID=UPI001C127DDD|nr:DEAD/DEAH box helicase [Caproiciproducens sp. MSJ-32]MBU5455858.1 DEAD/DEAH box helicase [Caproiciproducens sp. MSJ-32]
MNKKKISAHTIKTIVIDEADNLLDNTSSAFVKDIIKKTMKDREILIFSATINKNTLETAKALMKDPVIFKNESNFSLNPVIEHIYIKTDPREKSEVLRKLTSAINPQKAVVFVNNVYNIDLVAERLNYHNKNAFAMHNKLTKEQRQNAMEKFRK